MTGKIIFSLDCEGKWGVADHLTKMHHRQLSDVNLRATYAAISKAFSMREVPATFAGVSLFTMDDNSFSKLDHQEISRSLPYTQPAFADLTNGSGEGWRAPWYRDVIGDTHEIASHGATHTPFDSLDDPQVDLELSLIDKSDGDTLVFPRNKVAHLERIAAKGFKGYRKAPPQNSRLKSLASEFDLASRSQKMLPADFHGEEVIVPIPAGYFINWKAHLRRLVPTAVTRLRARRVMRDAVAHGGIAHFWTHPENIATHPATMQNLIALIEEAVQLRDAGSIEIMTQRDYVSMPLV